LSDFASGKLAPDAVLRHSEMCTDCSLVIDGLLQSGDELTRGVHRKAAAGEVKLLAGRVPLADELHDSVMKKLMAHTNEPLPALTSRG